MDSVLRLLRTLWRDESGITSVEYAILLAFIAGRIIFAAEELANAVMNEMTQTATCISSAGANC